MVLYHVVVRLFLQHSHLFPWAYRKGMVVVRLVLCLYYPLHILHVHQEKRNHPPRQVWVALLTGALHCFDVSKTQHLCGRDAQRQTQGCPLLLLRNYHGTGKCSITNLELYNSQLVVPEPQPFLLFCWRCLPLLRLWIEPDYLLEPSSEPLSRDIHSFLYELSVLQN